MPDDGPGVRESSLSGLSDPLDYANLCVLGVSIMKITCENCGASYKIPEEKLTRDVSKATCKKCGSKIVIRRPGGDGYEDPRLTGGLHSHGEDDGVVEHNEERTVIAHVPELQRYDATPPLTTSVPDPSQSVGSMGVTGASVRQTDEVRRVTAPAPAPAAARAPTASTGTQTPVSAPVQAQAAAPVAPAPAPASVAAPVSAVSSTGAASTGTMKPVSRPAKKAGASWVAIPPLGVAILGLLLFIPDALWGMANFQAVGFMLALFGALAALVLQVELIRTGSLNIVLGFLVPSLGVVGLGFTLLQIQEVPFLDEEIKGNLEMIIQTASQPVAPDAQPESLTKRVKNKQKQIASRPRLTNTPNIDTSGLTNPDPGTGEQPGLKSTGEATDAAVPVGPGTTGVLPTTSGRARRPGEDRVADKPAVEFESDSIDDKLLSNKVQVCFTTSLQGQPMPKGLVFEMWLSPDGKVSRASIASPSEWQASALEKCLVDRVKLTNFGAGAHNGTGPEKYVFRGWK